MAVPKGVGTRPSAERVREALAGSLQATGGLDGARVLDLWAGTGALGLELASRGASSAVFVEKDRMALTALRANVRRLIGNEPRVAERLEVHAMASLGLRLYQAQIGRVHLASKEDVDQLLRRHVAGEH